MIDKRNSRNTLIAGLVALALIASTSGALAQPAVAKTDSAVTIANSEVPDAAQPPKAPSGVSGPAMYLNGTDYVSVPRASLPVIGANDFSLEAWIYPTSVAGCHAVLAMDYTRGFWFGVCNGKLRFHRGSTSFVESTATIPANVWTHIAVESYYDPFAGVYDADFIINGDFDGTVVHAGATSVGGTRELRIGEDQPFDYFAGDIAEARLWNFQLDYLEIRRNMHHALQEKRSGLVADWHLAGDFKDSIGGINGTPVGSPQFVGFPSPAQPDIAAVDRFFSQLPAATYATAAAFVPRLNRALLVGGYRGGVPSALVSAVDAGTGTTSNIGTLPAARGYASAAYAVSNDTVYVFGGSDQLNTTNAFDSIYAINPQTGAVRTLAAALPAGRDDSVAVYMDGLDKIVILGGWYYSGATELYANSVYIFDVASETISTAPFTLSQAAYGAAAAYSPLTQKVYLFGGSPDGGATFDNKGYALTLNADGSGGVTTLGVTLPAGDRGSDAVEDPLTGMIYFINGQTTGRVLAFDPVNQQLWQTPLELPRDDAGALLARPYSSVIYSPRNRHALVLGGGFFAGSGDTNVWRIPLGNGPAVPVGNWDFTYSRLGNLDFMSSVYWRVAMGRSNMAVTYFDSDGYVRYPSAGRNGTAMTGMAMDPADGSTWFNQYGNNFVNVQRDTGSTIQTIYNESRPTGVVYGFAPGAVKPNNGVPFFGNGYQMYWQNVYDPILHTWHTSFGAPNGNSQWQWTHIPAIAHRNGSEAWAIVEPWYNVIGLAIGPTAPVSPTVHAPTSGPAATRPQLGRLNYTYYGTAYSTGLYGYPCGTGLWASDMVFGLNGDWWIGGSGGVCRYSAAFPPTLGYGGNLFAPTIGAEVRHLSVDGDGRIWASVSTDLAGNSGGLTAYEVLGPANTLGTVRTQDWNWLTAPIGTLHQTTSGQWDSTIRTLTANGERVWMALNTDPNNGPLAMYSPRWQHLDASNQADLWGVRKVWLARGMAFLATNGGNLDTLMPDAITWDSRPLAGVNAVLGDSKGRVWVGAADGVRRWLPTGWDMIDGALGTPPTGPINALAQDSRGRIWVGGANGLTLYDKERWVATLPTPFGAISVTALLVDRDDNVWAGTAQGLARLNAAGESWTTYGTADGLFTNSIFSLALLSDGQIAVSTSGTGGGVSIGNGPFAQQAYPRGADQPLTADQLGRLWAGAILREPTGYYGRFWTNSGLISSQVVGNAADGADRVWFTHPSGGVSIRSTYLPVLSDVQPQISPANGVVPNRGSAGDIIAINGSGFGTSTSDVEVTLGGAPADISSVTDNQIIVRLRGDNLTGDVSVRRGKRRATLSGGAAPAFCAVPKISGVTPTGGNVGVTMKLSGTNFDADATVQLGGGAPSSLGVKGAGNASILVNYSDTSGNIVVTNKCAGATATWSSFLKINVTLNQASLNQGYVGMGLYSRNSTLASAWVSVDQAPRPAPFNDLVQVDRMQVSLSPARLNTPASFVRAVAAAIPFSVGAPKPAFLLDTANAVNLPNIIYYGVNQQDVNFELTERGRVVATSNASVNLQETGTPDILLVPVMHDGFTPQQLADMKAQVDSGLADYRNRIYPGGLSPRWADEVVPQSKVTSTPVITISDAGQQLNAGIEFERIRQRFNADHGAKVAITFGVVESATAVGGGMGILGELSKWRARNDCEASFLSGVKDFFGFDKGCGPEYPQFLGWASSVDPSRLFAHELGHMMGLVPTGASNFAVYSGPGGGNHSGTSELVTTTLTGPAPAACGDAGSTFAASATLYRQAGVAEPVVDPIDGTQLYNNLTAALPITATRGRSLMSYACNRAGNNTYFEPPDLGYLTAQRFSALRPFYSQALYARMARAARSSSARGPLAGPAPERIHVAGIITSTGGVDTGAIVNVEVKGPQVKTSADYQTGYELVQYDAGGTELLRWGILPLTDFLPNNHPGDSTSRAATNAPLHSGDYPAGMFSANLPKSPGVARIDLVTGTSVLASFSAGPNAPVVAISSPAGGENFTSGTVPVAWTVADADGDPTQVAVEYSADDGATWTPVADGHGSGTANIPVEQLAGSAKARVRVWASDGFLSGTMTSAAFAVAVHPPLAYILSPQSGSTFLEGQPSPLQGRADDPQDGVLTSTASLSWSSNRDGALGAGETLYPILSAGVHTITLVAQDSQGLTATAIITVNVLPNYAGDGIPDDQKVALGLNVLSARDAFSDTNGNGFTLVEQLHFGTDPTADLPPDVMSVWPPTMTFSVDLAQQGQLPQQLLQAFSRAPVTVTLATDAPWLDFSTTSAATPAVSTLVLNPILLEQGMQSGVITVSSSLGTVIVPVTVTVINKGAFCDANGDGKTDFRDVAAVQAQVGRLIGQPGYDYHYDLNRDGSIDAQDVALARTCVVAYGNPALKAVYLPAAQR